MRRFSHFSFFYFKYSLSPFVPLCRHLRSKAGRSSYKTQKGKRLLRRLVYLREQQREQSNIPNKSHEQSDLPNESLEYLLAVMNAILLYVKREVIGISLLFTVPAVRL